MIAPELAGAAAQFGVAGLIGWMWLTERRAATSRDRQIDEAHDRLIRERTDSAALMQTVRHNTRVMASLEATQRELLATLRGLLSRPG